MDGLASRQGHAKSGELFFLALLFFNLVLFFEVERVAMKCMVKIYKAFFNKKFAILFIVNPSHSKHDFFFVCFVIRSWGKQKFCSTKVKALSLLCSDRLLLSSKLTRMFERPTLLRVYLRKFGPTHTFISQVYSLFFKSVDISHDFEQVVIVSIEYFSSVL